MKEKYEYTTYDPVGFTPTKRRLDISKVIVDALYNAFNDVDGVEIQGVFIDPETKGLNFSVIEDIGGIQTLTNYIRIEPRAYTIKNDNE